MIESGMGGGGIAAIVIAICVVFGVAGVLIVMLKNRNWEWRSLIPPRAATLLSTNNNNDSSPMASFGNMSYNSSSGTVQRS